MPLTAMPALLRKPLPACKGCWLAPVPQQHQKQGWTFGWVFSESVRAKLSEVPGLDAILFGHLYGGFRGGFFRGHPRVNLTRGTTGGVAAVMPGASANHLPRR